MLVAVVIKLVVIIVTKGVFIIVRVVGNLSPSRMVNDDAVADRLGIQSTLVRFPRQISERAAELFSRRGKTVRGTVEKSVNPIHDSAAHSRLCRVVARPDGFREWAYESFSERLFRFHHKPNRALVDSRSKVFGRGETPPAGAAIRAKRAHATTVSTAATATDTNMMDFSCCCCCYFYFRRRQRQRCRFPLIWQRSCLLLVLAHS
mmetsp:Transcript_35763/g.60515  ORF Transcript_35763/g.60515 Transcript_35763/m.60515 type:complete len:205 (+) Transcript_35763:1284-1898(+)